MCMFEFVSLFFQDLAFVCPSGRLGAKVCGRGFGARMIVYMFLVAAQHACCPQRRARVSTRDGVDRSDCVCVRLARRSFALVARRHPAFSRLPLA